MAKVILIGKKRVILFVAPQFYVELFEVPYDATT